MPQLQWEVTMIIGHRQPTFSYKSGSVNEKFSVVPGDLFCVREVDSAKRGHLKELSEGLWVIH